MTRPRPPGTKLQLVGTAGATHIPPMLHSAPHERAKLPGVDVLPHTHVGGGGAGGPDDGGEGGGGFGDGGVGGGFGDGGVAGGDVEPAPPPYRIPDELDAYDAVVAIVRILATTTVVASSLRYRVRGCCVARIGWSRFVEICEC